HQSKHAKQPLKSRWVSLASLNLNTESETHTNHDQHQRPRPLLAIHIAQICHRALATLLQNSGRLGQVDLLGRENRGLSTGSGSGTIDRRRTLRILHVQGFHRILRLQLAEPLGTETVPESLVQDEIGAVVVPGCPGKIEGGHEGIEVRRAAEIAEIEAADQSTAGLHIGGQLRLQGFVTLRGDRAVRGYDYGGLGLFEG
ncbi:MAG: hypothetical protein Q9191_008153, partial [Dirinaria sp. TL-2023a]